MRFLLRVLTLMSNRRDPGLRAPLIGLYGALTAGNLAAWAWALLAFHDQPLLLGTALLAYGFGLRHAVDADHIAAIDNVTRKLMHEGKRPLCVGLISRSWHMFPLGFLFGLGFDTATEVALLGLSATQAAQGVSVWSILVFPALFAAGMALIDTTDGVLMLGAYNWAFVKPIRKLYYNLTITLVSVVVAFLIGGIELLGLLGDRLGLSGWFWQAVGGLTTKFHALGPPTIAVFHSPRVGASR